MQGNMSRWSIDRVGYESDSESTYFDKYVSAGRPVIVAGVTGQQTTCVWRHTVAETMDSLSFFANDAEVSVLEADVSTQTYDEIQDAEEFGMPLTMKDAVEMLEMRATEDPLSPRTGSQSANEVVYVKCALTGCTALMDRLHLPRFANPKQSEYTPAAHPLLLQPGSYFCWAYIGEKGSGSRTHVDVAASDAWLTVLTGSKEWAMVHPLDKHLVVDQNGHFADLFDIDYERFPHAQRARVSYFTQRAGEAVFVPSEAPHCVRNLEYSISITYNFSPPQTTFRWKAVMDKIAAVQEQRRPRVAIIDIVIFCPTATSRATLRGFVDNFEELPETDFQLRMRLDQLHAAWPFYQRILDGNKVAAVPVGYDISRQDHRIVYFYRMPSRAAFDEVFGVAPFATELCDPSSCRPSYHFPLVSSHFGAVPAFPPLRVMLNLPLFSQGVFPRCPLQSSSSTATNTTPTDSPTQPPPQWHYARFQFSAASAASWCRTYLFYSSSSIHGPVSLHPLTSDATLQTPAMLQHTELERERTIRRDSPTPTAPSVSPMNVSSASLSVPDVLEECPHFESFFWSQPALLASSGHSEPPALYDLGDDLVRSITTALILADDGAPLKSVLAAATAHGFSFFDPTASPNQPLHSEGSDSLRASVSDTQVAAAVLAEGSVESFVESVLPIERILAMGLEKLMVLVLWFATAPRVVGFSYSHTFSAVEEPSTLCLTASAASVLLCPKPQSAAAKALTDYCNYVDPPTGFPSHLDDESQSGKLHLEQLLREAFADPALLDAVPKGEDVVGFVSRVKAASHSKVEQPTL